MHDPDVTISLRTLNPLDAGSVVFNNRFSSRDMALRCRQISTLSELILQAQQLPSTPTPAERLATHRWIVATGDFNFVSDDRDRFYPLGTLNYSKEGLDGGLPPDVWYLELGVEFVKHWGKHLGVCTRWVRGPHGEGEPTREEETEAGTQGSLEQLEVDRALLGECAFHVGPSTFRSLRLEERHPGWLEIGSEQPFRAGLQMHVWGTEHDLGKWLQIPPPYPL